MHIGIQISIVKCSDTFIVTVLGNFMYKMRVGNFRLQTSLPDNNIHQYENATVERIKALQKPPRDDVKCWHNFSLVLLIPEVVK